MTQTFTRTHAMSLPDYLGWLATTIEPDTAKELRERKQQAKALLAACEAALELCEQAQSDLDEGDGVHVAARMLADGDESSGVPSLRAALAAAKGGPQAP